MNTKKIVVVVDGAPQGRDLLHGEIEPGTTARDVLNHFNLIGYALLPQGQTTHLSGDHVLWSTVEDGAKVRATPIAEVGAFGSLRQCFRMCAVGALGRFRRSFRFWPKNRESRTTQLDVDMSRAIRTNSAQPATLQSGEEDAIVPTAKLKLGASPANGVAKDELIGKARTAVEAIPARPRMRRHRRSVPVSTPPASKDAPVHRIAPTNIPLWRERGWKQQGNKLVGAFRTRRGGFVGEIILSGGDAGAEPSYYVFRPPLRILKSAHAACWRLRGGDRYWVHFTNKAPLDAGIAAIESQLTRFE